MQSSIKNIGKLSGKVLVFGGVYSNLQALEALQKSANAHGIRPENIICTGDIVGYCAQPSECLTAVAQWDIHAIQGNVEENILQGDDDCGCNFKEGGRCDLFSRQWFPYAVAQMNADNLNYLQSLPHYIDFTFADRTCRVLHGSMEGIADFVFSSSDWHKKANSFEKCGADVILAGHCGIPFADGQGDRLWLNAGVIGMPANDGSQQVWYMLLEETADGLTYAFCRLDYDCATANALMLSAGLPQSYAATLLSGIWDNCEILPGTESKEQGKRLVL